MGFSIQVLGGRGYCRACSFSPRSKIMQDALIRPIVRVRHQVVSNWVVSHVLPLRDELLIRYHSRVPMTRLPLVRRVLVSNRKACLPELTPRLERPLPAIPSCKQVNVVWHDNVAADEPPLRIAPDLQQQIMNQWVSEPRHSVLRAYRQEDNRLMIRRLGHTMRRALAGIVPTLLTKSGLGSSLALPIIVRLGIRHKSRLGVASPSLSSFELTTAPRRDRRSSGRPRWR